MERSVRRVLRGTAALTWAAVAVSGALRAGGDQALSARWAGYGRALLDHGRAEPAEGAFHKALALDERDLAAWAGLADAYKREGRAGKVLDTYAQMIQAVPKSRTAGWILARGWRLPPPPRTAGYFLYVSESGDGGFRKAGPLLTAPSLRVDGLVPGLRYYFMVTTLSDAVPPQESKPSPVWSMVCQAVSLR